MTVQFRNADFSNSVSAPSIAPLPHGRNIARKDRRLGLVVALCASAAGWATVAVLASSTLS